MTSFGVLGQRRIHLSKYLEKYCFNFRASVFVSNGFWSIWLSNYICLRKGSKDFDEKHEMKFFTHGLKTQNSDINTGSKGTCCLLKDCRLISNSNRILSRHSVRVCYKMYLVKRTGKTWVFIAVYNSVMSAPIYTLLPTKFLLLYIV